MKGAPLPSLRWAVGGLAVASLLAKLVSLLREILIANTFGVSADLDAVYLALSFPVAITVAVGGGFARAGVPIGAALSRGRHAGLAMAATQRLVSVLAPLALLIAVTSPLWTMLIASPGAGGGSRPLVLAGILGALALPGGAVAGLFIGLVNARGRHVTASLNPLFYNIVWLLAIVVLYRRIGAVSVAVGVLLAEWTQLAVQWPVLRALSRGERPVARREDFTGLLEVFWPAAVLGFAAGLNIAVDRLFAQTLGAGAIAGLTYADKVINLPVGLLGMALAVPLFTRLSRLRAAGNAGACDRAVLLGVRLLLVGGVPLAAILAAEARPILALLFERGAFDRNAVEISAQALAGFAWGLPFVAMLPLLSNAALAVRRPWRPVWILVAMTGVNALLDAVLVQFMGLFGIALATTIAAAARTFLLLAVIAPGVLARRDLWAGMARTALAGVVLHGGLALLMPAGVPEGWVALFGRLALAGIASGALLCLLWPVVLRAEMRSLHGLRRRVAADAAHVDGKPRGERPT